MISNIDMASLEWQLERATTRYNLVSAEFQSAISESVKRDSFACLVHTLHRQEVEREALVSAIRRHVKARRLVNPQRGNVRMNSRSAQLAWLQIPLRAGALSDILTRFSDAEMGNAGNDMF
jgi:hypothetical protein